MAETQDLEDGVVGLQVFRERDRVLEQDFWKMRVSGGAARRGEAVASLGPENDKALSAFMSAVAAGLVEGTARALSELIVFVRLLVESASGEVAGAFQADEPEPGHDRVSVRRSDTSRTLSPSIVLASIDLKTVVLLGPQPSGGYRLDRATLERFGSKGTRVSVFDGLLETEVLLGNPR